MESLNDLLGYRNLKIYQNSDWFQFSLDSVLLPNFVTIRSKASEIIDLGTGNLPIPLILSTKTTAHITAVEIQKDVYELAKKSLELNRLENQITLLNMDMKELKNRYSPDTFDIVLSNPPYFKYLETSKLNDDEHKIIARHEKMITLEEVIEIGSYLLKNGGIFGMVHRTERLLEIISLFEKYHVVVKRIQLVYPKEGQESNLVLVEGIKSGRSGVKFLPPLYIHNEDGSYRDEILKMFE